MTSRSLILVLLATIAFGISAFLRKVAIDRIHPFSFQMVASFVYAATVPLCYLLSKPHTTSSKLDHLGIWCAIIATVLGATGGVSVGFALRDSSSNSVVTTLSNASPIITIALSYAFLGERLDGMSLLGCLAILLGAMMICYR